MEPPAPLTGNGPFPAVWHDGKSANAHMVTLVWTAHSREVRLCDPVRPDALRPLAVWNIESIRLISGKLAKGDGKPARLGLDPDDGQRLVLSDAQTLAAMASWLRVPQAERNSRARCRWIVGGALVWMACIALYFGGSVLFSAAASVIPRSWEEALGRSARENVVSVLESMHAARGESASAGADPGLRDLLGRLEQAMPAAGYSFDLLVLEADFVNAFALPGGYMLVTTGLIEFCRTPDELAGVLAHEMSHVTERHGTGAALRQYAWSGLLHMLGGNNSLAGGLALNALVSSFSRDDERTADALGAERLLRAGISPRGMADFFDRLRKEEGVGENAWLAYLSSHPESGERRDALNSRLERALQEGTTPAFTPAMTPEAWQRLRAKTGSGNKLTGSPIIPTLRCCPGIRGPGGLSPWRGVSRGGQSPSLAAGGKWR